MGPTSSSGGLQSLPSPGDRGSRRTSGLQTWQTKQRQLPWDPDFLGLSAQGPDFWFEKYDHRPRASLYPRKQIAVTFTTCPILTALTFCRVHHTEHFPQVDSSTPHHT